mmetsp:Transcript_82918/g.231228  ORF Transcript_82918/g.231228 Transcript_82918/m.231228 type:complete len:172 (+) Transcript_82918:83-598(+)
MQGIQMFAALVTAAFVAEGVPVVVFKAGVEPVGVYYVGKQDLADAGKVELQQPDHEIYVGKTEPNNEFTVTCSNFDAFVLRIGDLRHRTKVITFENTDSDKGTYPYKIGFKNVMIEGMPIELKHGPEHHIWIEPGHTLTHRTNNRGLFELRDTDKRLLLTVRMDEQVRGDL